MTPTTSTQGPESDDGRQDAPGATDAATEAREAIDLDAIEKRAKAATPGPWEARGEDYPWVALYDDEAKIPEHESLPSFDSGGTATAADAEHIAGMNPATTLALVRELREARAATWADVAALLNDRAQMWEAEPQRGHQARASECRELANAFRTYAEGVGIPSMQSLRQKRRAAEAERDDLRARLAKVKALADEWGEMGRDVPARALRAALRGDR